MATSGERDLDRAKDLKSRSKQAGISPDASRILRDAAERLERRGARKLAKLARGKRKRTTERHQVSVR